MEGCPILTGIAISDLHLGTNSAFAHGRNRVTLRLLKRGDVGELLDYGCGRAEFAIAAARELGLVVHACDVDAGLIAELTAKHGEHVDFFAISDSEAKLPFADGELPAISCCDVLEHIPPEPRADILRELRRVLAEDGVIVVTTPHKGLFTSFDQENVKYYFPRLHRFVYRRIKGADLYRKRYEGERFGNYSAGAQRHEHFSARELTEMLRAAGFEVQEIAYFTLLGPLVRPVLWVAENLAGRVKGASPLRRLCWKLYVWDADLDPGRLASSIAVRATRRA